MSSGTSTDSLQPWQFFVLAALGCATAVVFVARGRGLLAVVLLTVLMFTVGIAGLAALRMFRPLFSRLEDRTVMIGGRTRAALEREKFLTLRAIKDLEFDRAMGKVSESDFHEMSTRMRARAAGLIRQLDAGHGYRQQIEEAVTKRLGEAPEPAAPARTARFCSQCGSEVDSDARFCKSCGHKL
jgi:zinc-ribbon domain